MPRPYRDPETQLYVPYQNSKDGMCWCFWMVIHRSRNFGLERAISGGVQNYASCVLCNKAQLTPWAGMDKSTGSTTYNGCRRSGLMVTRNSTGRIRKHPAIRRGWGLGK